MTRKEFRHQGYAGKLIKKVLEDYAGKCDGIYLFGNLNALGFYEKMGFAPCAEDVYLFVSEIYDGEDDYRLFIYGEELQRLRQKSFISRNSPMHRHGYRLLHSSADHIWIWNNF